MCPLGFAQSVGKLLLSQIFSDAYTHIKCFLMRLATLPVTVVAEEQFFGTLERPKTYFRNNIEQNRLTGTAFVNMTIETRYHKKLNIYKYRKIK